MFPSLIRGISLFSRKSAKTDESFNTKRCTLWFDEYTGVDDANVIGKHLLYFSSIHVETKLSWSLVRYIFFLRSRRNRKVLWRPWCRTRKRCNVSHSVENGRKKNGFLHQARMAQRIFWSSVRNFDFIWS